MMPVASYRFCAIGAGLLNLLICTVLTLAHAAPSAKAAPTQCEETEEPGMHTPAPTDPYPLKAAGWEPEAGNGLQVSRWAARTGRVCGVVVADLRLDPAVRVYGEIATGQVDGRRSATAAHFQNDAALQQLFVDALRTVVSVLVGAMVGRQEFAESPNLHRRWNGLRLYAHGEKLRAGGLRQPGSLGDRRAQHLLGPVLDAQREPQLSLGQPCGSRPA